MIVEGANLSSLLTSDNEDDRLDALEALLEGAASATPYVKELLALAHPRGIDAFEYEHRYGEMAEAGWCLDSVSLPLVVGVLLTDLRSSTTDDERARALGLIVEYLHDREGDAIDLGDGKELRDLARSFSWSRSEHLRQLMVLTLDVLYARGVPK